jgi:hypothetical protein
MQQNQLHLLHDSTQGYARKEGTHIATITNQVNSDTQVDPKTRVYNYYQKTPELAKIHASTYKHVTPLLATDVLKALQANNHNNSLV